MWSESEWREQKWARNVDLPEREGPWMMAYHNCRSFG